MSYSNTDEFKTKQFEKALDLITFNGHEYVDGNYITKKSPLTVYCLTHKFEHKTTFTNYTRCKTGMPCCGKRQTSEKLLNRKYKPETLKLMSQSALERPKRSSTGQHWRRSAEAREWEKQVKDDWNYECAISGRRDDIEMHHFYSGARSSDVDLTVRNKLIYDSRNGLVLHKFFHVNFHKRFGYTENTLDQFQEYVKILKKSISSQAQQECWEGSETRVDDLKSLFYLLPYSEGVSRGIEVKVEKIMKLHERLEEIKESIKKDIFLL